RPLRSAGAGDRTAAGRPWGRSAAGKCAAPPRQGTAQARPRNRAASRGARRDGSRRGRRGRRPRPGADGRRTAGRAGRPHRPYDRTRVTAGGARGGGGGRRAYRHSTFTTSNALAPPGVTTSTESPFFLPTRARASGEVMEIRFFLASASGSPTICHTFFSSVSSSITVTVAPNVMVPPDSL